MKHTRLALPLLAAFLAAAPVVRAAQPDHAEPGRKPHGKLAFVLTPAWLYLPMVGASGELAECVAATGGQEDDGGFTERELLLLRSHDARLWL
ncbi:MAG: hypothetical protein M1436_05830 [Acidobacteria bacterium]|nr:hypothetical protein [Acidobacteriota bacterium]